MDRYEARRQPVTLLSHLVDGLVDGEPAREWVELWTVSGKIWHIIRRSPVGKSRQYRDQRTTSEAKTLVGSLQKEGWTLEQPGTLYGQPSLHSGQPDADELRRLPAITDLADPTTEQEDTDYGTLTDYRTGEPIRPATAAEHTRSLAAGGTGVFEDQDGRAVFVAGGPES